VALATVHRPEDLARAVASALASDHPSFEVRVVDQSAGDASERSLAPFADDPRLCYRRHSRRGLAAALNLAAAESAAEIVAITGDDCVARTDWLREIEREFAADRRLAVLFGSVVPGRYDGDDGFVPGCVVGERHVGSRLADLPRLNGTTACMAVRREAWRELGGFDEAFGVGAPLRSAEDLDLALRALLAGWRVAQTPRVVAEHRSPTLWRDRAVTIRRNWYGSGAAFAKGFRPLAQAHRLGGDLDELVALEELERLLEVHQPRRHQVDGVVGARGAHVGELLLAHDVDVQVVARERSRRPSSPRRPRRRARRKARRAPAGASMA
jgi:GT2 family glycosyltransferase